MSDENFMQFVGGCFLPKIIKNEKKKNLQRMIFICGVITSHIHVGHTFALENIISGELPSLECIFLSAEH